MAIAVAVKVLPRRAAPYVRPGPLRLPINFPAVNVHFSGRKRSSGAVCSILLATKGLVPKFD